MRKAVHDSSNVCCYKEDFKRKTNNKFFEEKGFYDRISRFLDILLQILHTIM